MTYTHSYRDIERDTDRSSDKAGASTGAFAPVEAPALSPRPGACSEGTKTIPLRDQLSHVSRVHFVGIGGIGMSALASLALQRGLYVQGSDHSRGKGAEILAKLAREGAVLFDDHSRGRLGERREPGTGGGAVDAVIISSAIGGDNPEVIEALELGIPVVHRSCFLRYLLREQILLAVSATHGKTTTTSLLGAVLDEAELDPLILSGGIMEAYGSNVRVGEGAFAVVEADESDRSLLNFDAIHAAIVMNIEPEHLAFHRSFDAIVEMFSQFISRAHGFSVVCADDPGVALALERAKPKAPVHTYGFGEGCCVQALNPVFFGEGMIFDIRFRDDGIVWQDVELALKGEHNVLNALAVVTVCRAIGISEASIRKAFLAFRGVKRRLTLTGSIQDIAFFDDYAHHPTAVEAVLKTLRRSRPGKIYAVVQPHRYSRLHECFHEFLTCFSEADEILFLPVYAAGEPVTFEHLLPQLAEHLTGMGKAVTLFDNSETGHSALADYLRTRLSSGDAVACLGAGDVTLLAYALPWLVFPYADLVMRSM